IRRIRPRPPLLGAAAIGRCRVRVGHVHRRNKARRRDLRAAGVDQRTAGEAFRYQVSFAVAEKKPKPNYSNAWREARALIWQHRRRLGIGLALMLVNRLAGLVLPASSKYLIDHVIGEKRVDMLGTIALAAGAATVIQAITSYGLSQILGV